MVWKKWPVWIWMVWALGFSAKASAATLHARIEWVDRVSPPVVRVLLVSVQAQRTLWEKTAHLERPLTLRLPNLSRGLYLLILEPRAYSVPLIRWVHLQGSDDQTARVVVRLNRETLSQLRQRFQTYRRFLQILHRSPLHDQTASDVAPPREQGSSTHGAVEVEYAGVWIPSPWHEGLWIQATGWKWHWQGLSGQLRGQVEGQWIRGLAHHLRGAGEIHGTFGTGRYLELRAVFERIIQTGGLDGSVLHHGWLSIRTRMRLGASWQVQLAGWGRALMQSMADDHWTYWSEVWVSHQTGAHTQVFAQTGLGRIGWWGSTAVRSLPYADWWITSLWIGETPSSVNRRWIALGLRKEWSGSGVEVQTHWDHYQWQLLGQARQLAVPGIRIQTQVPMPIGHFLLAYELRRMVPLGEWGESLLRPWTRQVALGYWVSLPSFGRFFFRYTLLNGWPSPWILTPIQSRRLDLEWTEWWTEPLTGATVQIRLMILNALDQPVIGWSRQDSQPDILWTYLPRTWAWSVITRW